MALVYSIWNWIQQKARVPAVPSEQSEVLFLMQPASFPRPPLPPQVKRGVEERA